MLNMFPRKGSNLAMSDGMLVCRPIKISAAHILISSPFACMFCMSESKASHSEHRLVVFSDTHG
jgi:hypothetical protein